ncbi:MAG: guanylate kinase [Gemmatimonadetes bacterium]|nr:guanylate kinase [Gemmatimonadota bacterium]
MVVLSSPSGGGKTTIARRLVADRADVTHSISATTRVKRAGEVDGVSYHFLSRDEFTRRVGLGEFLEWAEYGGNLYGTLRSEVARGFSAGRHVVLDVEVQGADQLRAQADEAVHVFVLPPSGRELMKRLADRGTESPEAYRRRLAIAGEELGAVERYDYVVINESLDAAVAAVGHIIDAEAARPRRLAALGNVVATMRRELLET